MILITTTILLLQTEKRPYDDTKVIPETLPSTSLQVTDLEIQDIEGIGPTTAKKLKEAGIVSVMDLAVTSADELAVDINASKESAASIHNGSPETSSRFSYYRKRICYGRPCP